MVVPVVAALPVIFVDQYGETRRRQAKPPRRDAAASRLARPADCPRPDAVALGPRAQAANRSTGREGAARCAAGRDRRQSRGRRSTTSSCCAITCDKGASWSLPQGPNSIRPRGPSKLGSAGRASCRCRLRRKPSATRPTKTTSDFKVFSLKVAPTDVPSNAYLQLPDTEPQDIADSLREPTFFKAVVPIEDSSDDRQARRHEAKADRAGARTACRNQRPNPGRSRKKSCAASSTPTTARRSNGHSGKRDEIVPNWLLFDSGRDREAAIVSAAELAARAASRRSK